ncbi:MAG: hypothetical protein Tsb0027_25730 [Wenzhouxiangellaceae bacterium]
MRHKQWLITATLALGSLLFASQASAGGYGGYGGYGHRSGHGLAAFAIGLGVGYALPYVVHSGPRHYGPRYGYYAPRGHYRHDRYRYSRHYGYRNGPRHFRGGHGYRGRDYGRSHRKAYRHGYRHGSRHGYRDGKRYRGSRHHGGRRYGDRRY